MYDSDMRLYVPTDFEILDRMSDGERYTPSYMGELMDLKNNYMSNRLRQLESYGFVERIGSSTMFAITESGHAALELRDDYSHEGSAEWGEQVRELADAED